MYCKYCGKKIEKGQDVCLNCGKVIADKKSQNPEAKSKIVAGILAILLGAFGIHNFYLGYNSKATAQLLITVLSCFVLSFVSVIWGIIEGVMILTGNINQDASGNYLID